MSAMGGRGVLTFDQWWWRGIPLDLTPFWSGFLLAGLEATVGPEVL